MAVFDEEPVRKRRPHEVGQDLSALSVDDLQLRIVELRGEIARVEADMKAKSAIKNAADALFRKS
jgi:uncharacterized small protein (DUF1192 family)